MSYPLPPPEIPPIVETLPSQSVNKSVTDILQGLSTPNQKESSPISKFNQVNEEIRLSAKNTFLKEEFRETVLYKLPQITSTFDQTQKVSPIYTTSANLGTPIEVDILSIHRISTLESQINSGRSKTFSFSSFSDFSEYTFSEQEPQTTRQIDSLSLDSRKILEHFKSTKQPIAPKFQIGQTIEEKNAPKLPNLIQDKQPSRKNNTPKSEDNKKGTSIPIPKPESETQDSENKTEDRQPIKIPLLADVVEVTADIQEYDEQRQLITAEGKVTVRFNQRVINADKVQVNLTTRQLLATGNTVFTQGEQVLLGERMEYNFTLDKGLIEQASGIIVVGNSEQKTSSSLSTIGEIRALGAEPLSARIAATQPPTKVKTTGTAKFTFQSKLKTPGQSGTINRLRFEADRLNLLGAGTWEAINLRLTNDPFSPPEVELRSDRATFRPLSPFQDELITKKSRLVFDQRFSLPLFRERTIIDRQERERSPIKIGYDQDDRGGLFVESTFEPFLPGPLQIKLTPQYYLGRAFFGGEEGALISDNVFGLKSSVNVAITPTTQLEGRVEFLTFKDFPDLEEDKLRGSIRLRQLFQGYNLTGEYSYRDRLYNGSLGFQTVHKSTGVILISPIIPIGKTGAELTFQTGYQSINARTDRRELLTELQPFEPLPDGDNDGSDPRSRADINRFQGLVSLKYPLTIWRGEALSAIPTEGLKYSGKPVVPFLQIVLRLTGATTLYSNDENQSFVRGSLGFTGQFGHFSRDFFDYTGFNLIYSKTSLNGQSPFFFDRVADTDVFLFGLVQQIYQGFRVGYQRGINLKNGKTVDDRITLEYSRRSYGVVLSFSPRRQTGKLSFRISDFNWKGGTTPFSGEDVRPISDPIIVQ
ncbi:MAG: DUF3769 domain-containing protein [Trichodesmium sp. MAG_R04]|nr:DUF3769 domain-containing protein [Trichodesmium sp. MAG_R04]